MDFGYLLELAQKNKAKAEKMGQVQRYSTEIKPPKKEPRTQLKSNAIQSFLNKKAQEEKQKAIEEQRKKEKLLALRAQNAKNQKKAKLMASRTKDNDFSRIKLTEDEVETKQKVEKELQRKMILDKLERMKQRILIEEQEQQLPHKRKRKSKSGAEQDHDQEVEQYEKVPEKRAEPDRGSRFNGGNAAVSAAKSRASAREDEVKPKPKPRPANPPPSLNFHDLLKVAAAKQHEPIDLPVPKAKEEERPLTKVEKRRLAEEEIRKRGGKTGPSSRTDKQQSNSSVTKANDKLSRESVREPSSKSDSKHNMRHTQPELASDSKVLKGKPSTKSSSSEIPRRPVNNVGKSASSSSLNGQYSSKSHMAPRKSQSPVPQPPPPQYKTLKPVSKQSTSSAPQKRAGSPVPQPPPPPSMQQKRARSPLPQPPPPPQRKMQMKSRSPVPQPPPPSSRRARSPVPQPPPPPQKRARSPVPQPPPPSMKRARSPVPQPPPPSMKRARSPVPQPPPPSMKRARSPLPQPPPPSKKLKQAMPPPRRDQIPISRKLLPVSATYRPTTEAERMRMMKQGRSSLPPNPYMDMPRNPYRRPFERPYKRIESDDEEEYDEELADFIDDGPIEQQEDYSKYIREIFGYDRRRYLNEDEDDEAMESSFVQQMKEESRSARIGLLEDLEDMRKEQEELKRKKALKKKK